MWYRQLFEGIDEKIQLSTGKYGVPINLDNAATTPALAEISHQMKGWLANYGAIGRGTGYKGDWSSTVYEETKLAILDFFNAQSNPNYSVVYTKSTTEGINILSNYLISEKEDMVLVSRMEHHANDLPWRVKGTVQYIEVDEKGRVCLDALEKLLQAYRGRVKCVAITAASNVSGYINPIYYIAEVCHRYGAKLVVDAAQIVAHREVFMAREKREEEIDFLVYSGHKMYAPFGSGGIVGKFDEIANGAPLLYGGGIVEWVKDKQFKLEDAPDRLEAGTQNLIGILAMRVAMTQLKAIGFEQIERHENKLKNQVIESLKTMNHVYMYGDTEQTTDRLGVTTFNIKGKVYMDVANELADKYGIATRCGKFCAHPYVDRLMRYGGHSVKDVPTYFGENGMIRVSLGLYNTEEEVAIFLRCIEEMKN